LINTRATNNQGLLFTSHGFDYYDFFFPHVVKFMSESGIILKVTKNNYAMLQTNVKKNFTIDMEQ